MLSNPANRKRQLHEQAERNYRKKSGSRNLFLVRGRFVDLALGVDHERIFARGMVLISTLIRDSDGTAENYFPASAERLMPR